MTILQSKLVSLTQKQEHLRQIFWLDDESEAAKKTYLTSARRDFIFYDDNFFEILFRMSFLLQIIKTEPNWQPNCQKHSQPMFHKQVILIIPMQTFRRCYEQVTDRKYGELSLMKYGLPPIASRIT